MEFVNTRNAKARLSYYLNHLEDSGPVIITSRGVPKGVLTVFTDDELDSFAIRHSENIHKMAIEGFEEIREGETYSVDEALKKVAETRKASED